MSALDSLPLTENWDIMAVLEGFFNLLSVFPLSFFFYYIKAYLTSYNRLKRISEV